jgi:sugar lactone lactonase YvrE
MAATARAGCLIVLDNRGRVRETIAGHGINGPWDATWRSSGRSADLFVTNVLNGTVAAGGSVVHRGTVLRLRLRVFASRPPQLRAVTRIGSGFAQKTDPAAFVLGPTGVALSRRGTLFVADTENSRITAIRHAMTRHTSAGNGTLVSSGGRLNAPLGMTLAPNGNILTVNGGNGRIVETTPGGVQVASRFLDRSGSPPGAGALFGLTLAPHGRGVYYVDDAVNTLRLLH